MYRAPDFPSPSALRSADTWNRRLPSSTTTSAHTLANRSALLTTSPARSTSVIRISNARPPIWTGCRSFSSNRADGDKRNGPNETTSFAGWPPDSRKLSGDGAVRLMIRSIPDPAPLGHGDAADQSVDGALAPVWSGKMRHHLLTQQAQRGHHVLMRNPAAAVQLHQHAIQPEFLPKLLQPLRNRVRRADQDGPLQSLLIGHLFQPPRGLCAPIRAINARALGGIGKQCRLLAKEVDQARLRFRPRLRIGSRDIRRHAQEYAAALLARCCQSRAIIRDMRRDLRRRLIAHRHKYRQPAPAILYKCIGTGRRDTDLRDRLLERFRHHRDVLEVMELALIRDLLLRPRLAHDIRISANRSRLSP